MMRAESPAKDKSLPALPLVALALVSGAILAYELFIMRVFSNGGWSHFGSTVIAIAMFGFGVFSTVLCIWREAFKRRLETCAAGSLLLIGPSMVLANAAAQNVPFNPIFLFSDPRQKLYLAAYFFLYFIPFLLGATFTGLFFLMGQREFGKAYFANMAGSGFGGMVLFSAMYLLLPGDLLIVPLVLWVSGAICWFSAEGSRKTFILLGVCAAIAFTCAAHFEQIRVSPFKGVSYARQFPDARRVSQKASPFGYLEVYASSYFHFAPGLSDAASLYMDEMPQNAFLGMYIDGDGPIGIMRHLPAGQSEYVKYLSMALPYELKEKPDVLIMQFGGGISTNVALELGARQVTVAEGNPLVIQTVRDDPFVSDYTGRILTDERVHLVEVEGRILVPLLGQSFDIIDLSLADSTGLSMPAGASIYEKYGYTEETFRSCIRVLRLGGIFSVTVWNKEDPPKSVLKLMTTMIEAAGSAGSTNVGNEFFMTQTYLSTFTVLYKKGGFQPHEVAALSKSCSRLSFEIVYAPGAGMEPENVDEILSAYRSVYFAPGDGDPGGGGTSDVDVSAGSLYRAVAHRLIRGDASTIRDAYVFDMKPLTDDRPYFAGFVKPADIPRFLDKLETISDEWGYLLLWATLLLSVFFGMLLLALPVLFGWRALFSREPGKLGVIVYFLCLGLGYILIEVAFVSKCILCLGNSTVSFTVLVTGMLLFSGIGSYASGRLIPIAHRAIVIVCVLIGAILFLYALMLNQVLTSIGGWSYSAKASFCLALLAPLAFLLGFPFAIGNGDSFESPQGALFRVGMGDQWILFRGGVGFGAGHFGSLRPVVGAAPEWRDLSSCCSLLSGLLEASPTRGTETMNAHGLVSVLALMAALVLFGMYPRFPSEGGAPGVKSAMAGAPSKDLHGEVRGKLPPDQGRANQSMHDVTPTGGTGTFVQTLPHAPFPYSGKYEDTKVDFFDFVDPLSGQRFHTNRLGERYSEREHYSDGRVLFHVPSHFDPRKSFVYVLYFHALGTDIFASNRDYELTRQVDSSGRNVILVVPQLARNAADSSPGKFFRKNGFRVFMSEVGRVMTSRFGKEFQKKFDAAPIVLTAFSGGYKSVAYILDRGGANDRVKGVFLMDALYEDVDKFEKWIAGYMKRSFLVSVYTRGKCEENMKDLLSRLPRRGIDVRVGWPQTLSRGSIHHVLCDTDHIRIPLMGPPRDPLASLLELVDNR